jgi:hypothetical protein
VTRFTGENDASSCRPIAPAALDLQRHVQVDRLGERGDDQVRVDDLDVMVRLDVARGHRAGALLVQPQLGFAARMHADGNALEIQQDVDDILLHSLDAGVLVQHAVDLDFGHCATRHRRQQHASQCVAERVAEASLERLDDHACVAWRGRRDLHRLGLQKFRGGSLHGRHLLL